MVLRFYKGGPRAIKGRVCWVSPAPDPLNRDSGFTNGCVVALDAGAEIPDDTYVMADLRMSQEPSSIVTSMGQNITALLPIEE